MMRKNSSLQSTQTPGRTRPRVDAAWVGFAAAALLVTLSVAAPRTFADIEKGGKLPKLSKAFKGKLPITELGEEEATLHALNRLGFGPRPGDVERVRKMGLEKWIEQQLNPGRIDDSQVAQRLERYPTIAMKPEKLMQEFPTPQQAARQAGMAPEEYRKQQEERQKQREERQKMREEMSDDQKNMSPEEMREKRRRGLLEGDPNMPLPRLEDIRNPQRIVAELSMAKLTRAIYSERQLDEQLVDFWYNHFNVFAQKGPDRYMISSYESDVIRPHALGKFRDLLYATAKSPAMLFYLDNWQSADPRAAERLVREREGRRGMQQLRRNGRFGSRPLGRGGLGGNRDPFGSRDPFGNRTQNSQQRFPGGQVQPGQPQRPRQKRGLNENYARELMELHTLGVDGGYTQQDVIEVAKCFTGWTLDMPRRAAEFRFEDRIHDPDTKTVLGQKIHAGGVKDGEQVLDMLARHPHTAKFISTKLARKFVMDEPPKALVERMSKKFLDSDGDIRAVMHEMIWSPEFWSRTAYRAKIKKPLELVASTARALGTQVDVPLPLVMWTNRIGEPLYNCQPPTGYSDKAEAWVNTGALLNRLNFALALSGNHTRGAKTDVAQLLGADAISDPQKALRKAIELFLAGQVSPQTRATLEKQLADPQLLQATLDDRVQQVDAGMIAGLVLGSPEFQRR